MKVEWRACWWAQEQQRGIHVAPPQRANWFKLLAFFYFDRYTHTNNCLNDSQMIKKIKYGISFEFHKSFFFLKPREFGYSATSPPPKFLSALNLNFYFKWSKSLNTINLTKTFNYVFNLYFPCSNQTHFLLVVRRNGFKQTCKHYLVGKGKILNVKFDKCQSVR